MEQPEITVVINGNAYKLGAQDTEAIRSMPPAERQQLIALLEAIREEERLAKELADRSRQQLTEARSLTEGQVKPERFGRGDADALMARLVMEEGRDKKQLPTRQGLYKWIAVVAVLAIVLILIF